MITGAIEPGLTLSGAGVSGSPTLTACTANCAYTTAGAGATSTWTLSSNQGTIGSQTFTLTPAGGAAWPNAYPAKLPGKPMAPERHLWRSVVKFGTFSLSVNGTQVCADTATFAYNVQGGPCTGARDRKLVHQLRHRRLTRSPSRRRRPRTRSSWPWTNLVSRNATGRHRADRRLRRRDRRPAASGRRRFEKYPGGMSAHVFGGCVQRSWRIQLPGGYALDAPSASRQRISWFYGVRLPAIMPGQAAVPLHQHGHVALPRPGDEQSARRLLSGNLVCDQWCQGHRHALDLYRNRHRRGNEQPRSHPQ